MRMKNIGVVGFAFVFFLGLAMCAAQAGTRKTITLKIGGGHPSNTMAYTNVGLTFFQPRISERAKAETDYDVEWVDAYGGTVAKLPESLAACQDGLLDVMCSAWAFDNAKLFLMNMPFYVPFSSPDPSVAVGASKAVYEKYREVFDELWARYNQKLLAWGPSGGYELITNFPVKTLADLKGHKIAAAGANLPWLEGSGAIPVQSNLNEAYTCIQTGVYDGWVMWPDASVRFKLYEVAPYYTMVGFGSYSVHGISINLDVWEELPPEIQKIIEETAAEYNVKVGEIGREWDKIALETMKSEGVTVTTMDPAELAKWVNGLPEIPKIRAAEARDTFGFKDAVGFWKAFIQAQKDLGHKYPREWQVE